MEGTISNFCRNRHTTSPNQMVVLVEGVETRVKAQEFVGKKVSFTTGKKTLSGEVRSAHGNSGALRVLFETGMPGQAIGKKVEIK